MARYSKILAALDGGETRMAVARCALSLAHDNSSEVILAHVVESVGLEEASAGPERMLDGLRESVEEALSRQLARARADSEIPSVEVRVAVGRPAAELAAMAEETGADLVVCGNRGLSDLRYVLVGSVSSKIARQVGCDVLVVHPGAIAEIDESEYESYSEGAENGGEGAGGPAVDEREESEL